MDACLTEPTPAAQSSAVPARPSVVPWVRFALIATVAVGIAWRLVRYLAGFPIWGDEAMLLLNILERDYIGLTHQLRFAQVAPLLFLWLEKTALLAFGASEWSVHLFPFLGGLAALLFFWLACRSAFSPTIAGFAVAILAVSYYPVRHSAEVKPYAFDLLYACVYLWLTLGHLREPSAQRWLFGLVAVAPIAVFSSYPSAFVGGAVSLVLLPTFFKGTWSQRTLFIAFNMGLCGSFVIHYALVGQDGIDPADAERTREFLRNYWRDAFPPDAVYEWPLWLVRVFTGNMLAYPFGANHGGSTITFLLASLGAAAIWRNGQRSVFAMCLLPFALNLVAAMMHKYPFGDSARITLHLAPFICILMAHGIAHVLDWIRNPVWHERCQIGFYALLFVCGSVGLVRDVLKPYKTVHDREVRRLVNELHAQVGAHEPVILCHARDEEVIAEFAWYMRTQSWRLNWQSSDGLDSERSAWLVLCRNQEPSIADVLTHLGSGWQQWTVARSDVRYVPPENTVMPPMYCRWVHVIRAGR